MSLEGDWGGLKRVLDVFPVRVWVFQVRVLGSKNEPKIPKFARDREKADTGTQGKRTQGHRKRAEERTHGHKLPAPQ